MKYKKTIIRILFLSMILGLCFGCEESSKATHQDPKENTDKSFNKDMEKYKEARKRAREAVEKTTKKRENDVSCFLANLRGEIDFLNDSDILNNKDRFGVSTKLVFHDNEIVEYAGGAEVNFRAKNYFFGISCYSFLLYNLGFAEYETTNAILSAKAKILINENLYFRAVLSSSKVAEINQISGFVAAKMPVTKGLSFTGEVGCSYPLRLNGNIALAYNYGQFNIEIKYIYSTTRDGDKLDECNIMNHKSKNLQYSARAGFEGDLWSLYLGLNPTISFAEILIKL